MPGKTKRCAHGYGPDSPPCPACRDPKYVPEDGWLFYVDVPVAVVVRGTFSEAEAALKGVLETDLEETYVDWYGNVPNVERALVTGDTARPYMKGRIEEY